VAFYTTCELSSMAMAAVMENMKCSNKEMTVWDIVRIQI